MFPSLFIILSSFLKQGEKMLKKILFMALSLGLLNASEITGVGATFPLPIYKEWSKIYYTNTKNMVNYSGGGSGKGIASITSKTSDFGGSDEPQKPEVLKEKNLLQFPAIIGAVVLGYNVPGVKNLRLDASTLAKIYSGEISKWNDPAIVNLNPIEVLPNKDIIVITRSDSSGTTFNFTSYLSVDEKWAHKYGSAKSINWDAKVLPAASNPLVAQLIKQSTYSIGYLEYAYAKDIATASLKNSEGVFVEAKPSNFSKAGANAGFDANQGFYKVIVNAKGKDSYPLVAASFVLMHKDGTKNAEVAKFFSWALSDMDAKAAARKLGYEPIDAAVVEAIKAYLNTK